MPSLADKNTMNNTMTQLHPWQNTSPFYRRLEEVATAVGLVFLMKSVRFYTVLLFTARDLQPFWWADAAQGLAEATSALIHLVPTTLRSHSGSRSCIYTHAPKPPFSFSWKSDCAALNLIVEGRKRNSEDSLLHFVWRSLHGTVFFSAYVLL